MPRRTRSAHVRSARARSGQGGFTLIEIIVVVVIIGLLAAVVTQTLAGRTDDARIAKARQDIQAMETALTLFKLDNFRYPTNEQGLRSLVEKPADPEIRNWKEGGYVKRLSKDPWGRDYLYESPGTHGEVDIYTLGADGQAGGEKANADIGNWNLGQ
ncbi:MAG: type II secretion system major pseudopilin GspG [Pseudomonadota bacterium]